MRTNAFCLRMVPPTSVVITLYSHIIAARQIVQAIKRGRWTSTQVVTAFIKSALQAHDRTNCVTEGPPQLFLLFSIVSYQRILVLFAEALKTAGELDVHYAATGELKGPLHGVPISFKDLGGFKSWFGSWMLC